MRTKLGDQIREVLRLHVGEENFISAPDIARELGLRRSAERAVRDAIATESALWGDVIVCGIPGLGYFVAANLDEAMKYADCLFGLFTTGFAKWNDFVQLCERHGLKLTLGEEQRQTLREVQAAMERLRRSQQTERRAA